MRVKIIDEYNRIPTRTQSALLTVMGDNYAEMLDQIYECPDGGLVPHRQRRRRRRHLPGDRGAAGPHRRRRAGAVVQHPLPGRAARRASSRATGPRRSCPPQIVFTPSRARPHARRDPARCSCRRRCAAASSSSPASSSSSSRPATQFEYKTKDTARLAGVDLHLLTAAETGRDRLTDLGAQTRNGLSVRALHDAASSTPRRWPTSAASRVVNLEDLRQVLPFVLHDKLVPDLDAPFFEAAGNAAFRVDRVGWIRRLFDLSCAEYDRLDLDRDDPVAAMLAEFDTGPRRRERGRDPRAARAHRAAARPSGARGRKLYGTCTTTSSCSSTCTSATPTTWPGCGGRADAGRPAGDDALVTGAFAEFLEANRGTINHDVAAAVRQAAGLRRRPRSPRSCAPPWRPIVGAVDARRRRLRGRREPDPGERRPRPVRPAPLRRAGPHRLGPPAARGWPRSSPSTRRG